jgi:hypothetical protein
MIVVSKKGIVSLKDLNDQLVITGTQRGRTEISIGPQKYTIHVVSAGLTETQRNLLNWSKNKRGPSVQMEAEKVSIHGSLLHINDLLDLAQYNLQGSSVMIQCQISKKLKAEIQKWMDDYLVSQNLAPVQLQIQPYWSAKIQKSLSKELALYQKALSPYGIEVAVDNNTLAQLPTVEIKVYIAHLKKNFLREWGLEWPSQVSTQVVTPFQGKMHEFDLSLKAMESHGRGRLLATPTLITESGGEAQFHSGGEFPIRTTTQFNNNVQWKQYGLFLKVRPTANPKKHLHIGINIEMSALDQNLTSDGVPALQRSQIQTQINMIEPKPVVISGFLKSEDSLGRNGLPWLQQIPILNPLFSNGQIYSDELDLVFILVPQIYAH